MDGVGWDTDGAGAGIAEVSGGPEESDVANTTTATTDTVATAVSA